MGKKNNTAGFYYYSHTHTLFTGYGKRVVTDLPSVDKKDSGARDGWEGMISHVAHPRVINKTSDKQQESF